MGMHGMKRRNLMKRRIIMSMLLAAMTVGVTGLRAGAAGDGGQRAMAGEGWGPVEMMPPPDELIDHMAWQLRLTSEQQAKIGAVFRADREQTAPLMQKMAEYRKQLHDAAHAAPFDEAAIRAIAVKQAQAEVELIVSRERVRNRVGALLTPEQRSLADTFPPPFPRGREPGWRCCRGHMPPPPCDGERGHGPMGDEDTWPW